MNEQERPLNFSDIKGLLVQRDFHQRQIDILNQQLARLYAGIETLAEKQMRTRPPVLLPSKLPPIA